MLFTVVESRDGRLVAESADRKVKLTQEGVVRQPYPVGTELVLGPATAFEVVASASGPAAPDVMSEVAREWTDFPTAPEIDPITLTASPEDAEGGRSVEVTNDLSADPLDGVPDGA